MKTKQNIAKKIIFVAMLTFYASVFSAGSPEVPVGSATAAPDTVTVDNSPTGGPSDINNQGVASDRNTVINQGPIPCSSWFKPKDCTDHGCAWVTMTTDPNLKVNACN